MVRVLEVIGKRPKGGIGAFVINYQSHFPDDYVQIDYLIFSDEPSGDFDEKVKGLGSKIYVLPKLKNSRLIRIWKDINKFFNTYGSSYNAVHLHSVNIAFMVFPAARRNGIKYLLAHSHATMFSDKKLNGIRNYFLCKGLKKKATHYLACSIAAGDFLFGKNERYKVTVLNNAIECEKYAFSEKKRNEKRTELHLDNNYVIGHVGRFNEQKNHDYLIDIFREVNRYNNDARLLLVGDGPLRRKIENKVIKYGLEGKVIFLGQRNDVDELLMAMDVFVLPSLYEGLPVVGIEAQATGVPCVFSDSITNEVNIINVTFLSIYSKPTIWAETLMDIHKKSVRRDLAYKIISNKGYDINREATKLYKLYKSFDD